MCVFRLCTNKLNEIQTESPNTNRQQSGNQVIYRQQKNPKPKGTGEKKMYELWNAVTGTVTAMGVILAYMQWKSEIKAKCAERLTELLDRTRSDDAAQIFSVIDWDNGTADNLSYDGKFHVSQRVREAYPDINEKNIEFKIDRMLGLYSHVCYLHEQNVLKKKEMENFDYRLTRICSHEAVRNYLYSLYHFSAKQGTTMSFICLIDYCVSSGKLPSRFKQPNCEGCRRYLPA